jgi:hypothetical protein
VKWVLRVLAYSTIFGIPCRLASGAYETALAKVCQAILVLTGIPVTLRNAEVFAPVDLGIFLALCLATTAAPWRGRGKALLMGSAVLVLLEIVQVIAGNYLHPANRPALPANAVAWLRYLLQSTFWIGPAMVWLLLLGHHQLRSAVTGRRVSAPEPVLPAGRRRERSSRRAAGMSSQA